MSAPVTGPWVKSLQAATARTLLKQVVVSNKSAAAFWVWICDSAAGATAESKLAPHYVAANSRAVFDYSEWPRLMANGVYVAASTTATAPLTAIAADDCFIEVIHELFPS